MMPLPANHFGGVVFPSWDNFEKEEQCQYSMCKGVCVRAFV